VTRVLFEGGGLTRAELARALNGNGRSSSRSGDNPVLLLDGNSRDSDGRGVRRDGDFERRVERLSPDVVIIEAHGDEPLSSILPEGDLREWPPVILLVARPDATWTSTAMRAGVRAVVPREGSDIGAAIAAVAAGYIVLHPDAAESPVPAVNGVLAPSRSSHSLTPREIEVLRMMAEGLANKAIAARLQISEHTVKFHVGSIFAKLHAGSRTEAVTLGARQGLVML